MKWKQIKLVVVDLDNTLADTLHTLSRKQWEYVEKKLEEKNWETPYKRLKSEFGKRGFKTVLERSEMTAEQIRYAIKQYDKVEIASLRLFPDAISFLRTPMPKILISRGELGLQKKKIRHLRIRKYFKEIIIVPTFETKEMAFKRILAKYHLRPEELLVIGDRIEEEIAEGKRLGIPTVLVRRPDWPIGKKTVTPDLTVRGLSTLKKRLQRV